jgi:DNA-binding SARP family transcriptional activator
MSGDLDFRILGPLEVHAAGAPLPLRTGKQRTLLAVLLLSPNEVVSVDRLVDELWPDGRPGTATTVLHGHVSALRKLLGRDRLLTRAPGYLLRVGEHELDLARFERLRAEARDEADPRRRADVLRQALALWRGAPLVDVPCEGSLQVEISRLEELRLVALEDRFDADLGCGRHAELVPELERLVAEQPLRERLRGQLMLALYRAGRQAEALQVYAHARRQLVEELGIEPGGALKELERRILAQDSELAPPRAEPSVEEPPRAASLVRAGRRKRVTVLWAAAAHPPADEGRSDPESLDRHVAHSFELARPVLERHGAHLDRVLGDSFLAVFGVPHVHEDDALRAARAAVETRETLGPLGARIGIATGEVFVAGSTANGAVIGEPVKLAAQLEEAAAPGEIVLDRETYVLVRDAVVADPPEPDAAGAAAAAWRLVDVLPGAAGVARRLDAPLVGRERELAELERALDRVLAERVPHLFTLLGPAGIGKSRLAGELMARAAGRARTLLGRCQPYGEGITYWPLAEIVRQLVPEDPRKGLTRLLADEPRVETIVDRVLEAVGAGGSEAASRDEIFWAFRRLVESLARRGPLVVVFEDVHWAEPTFLDLVEYLADWIRDVPLFLLCLGRLELLEQRKAWAGGKLSSTSVLLEPLSASDAGLLVARHEAGDELDAETRGRIVEAAEGNPLFLEQMAAAARSEGGEAELRRPPTIDSLLASRLDRLPPEERATMECAAVQGAEFWRDAVADLLPEEVRLDADRWLDGLVAKRLIRPDPPAPSGRETFRFSHELIRQVAYEGAAKASRAELHERVGDWLGSSGGVPAELLGYHYEQAFRYREELGRVDEEDLGLAARAAALLAEGGRRASGRGDMNAASNLLGRALALLPPGAEERVELQYLLGTTLVGLGEFERGRSLLAEASEAAAARGDRRLETRAELELMLLLFVADPPAAAVELPKRCEAIVASADDDLALARAFYLLGFVPFTRFRYATAEAIFDRGLVHARRVDARREEAELFYFKAASAVYGPTPASEAIPYWEQLVEEYRGRPFMQATAAVALGLYYAMRKRFDEARELVAQGVEIYESLGMVIYATGTSIALGEVENYADDPAAVEAAIRPAYERWRDLGDRTFACGCADMLAEALYLQGAYDEAEGMTRASEELSGGGDITAEIDWRSTRAKVLARRGELAEAFVLLDEAAELAVGIESPQVEGQKLMDRAEVLLLAGRLDEAVAAAGRALALFEQKGIVPLAARARAFRDRAAAAAAS